MCFRVHDLPVFLGLVLVLMLLYLEGYSGNRITDKSFKSCLLEQSGHPRLGLISRSGRSKNQYNYLNYQWNKYYSQKMPLAYILPQSPEDVQVAVRCGSSSGVPIVAKSGGHSYPKYSFGNRTSVVLDLRKMDSALVDLAGRTVDVGSGILNGQLRAYLLQYGLFVPNGLCPSVGIGICLGGGYPTLVRTYGLIMDGLLEMDVVNAEGDLITANKRRNEDLFWALRGAGVSGSFGVVTRYRFRVHDVPRKVVNGINTYELANFPAVFKAFQNYFRPNPPKGIDFAMTMSPTNIVLKVFQVSNRGMSATAQSVKSILSLNFPPTKKTSVETLDFKGFLKLDSQHYANATNRENYGPIYITGSSFYVKNLISEAKIKVLNVLIQRLPKYTVAAFSGNGGAVNDFKPTDTAFVHRGQILYRARTDYEGPVGRTKQSEEESITWMREFYRLTKGLMNHTESYQNYADPELKDYLEQYYRENLNRLRAIKGRFDPNNYFSANPQAVPPLYD